MRINFRNEYGTVYTIQRAMLPSLKHGQEICISALRSAYVNAMSAGETTLTCFSDKGEKVLVKIPDALKSVDCRGDVKTLVVSCTDSGFIFTLPKEQKRANLIKNGYSPEKADELLKDAVETVYPLTKEGK